MRFTLSLSLIMAIVLLFAVSAVMAQERAIKRSEVPKAVIDAFTKAYPHATMREFSMEKEGASTVYEIESLEGKMSRDVSYAADGTLISLEESIPLSDVPAKVKAALDRDFPGASFQTIEKVREHGADTFEMLLTAKGTKMEVVYSPDGALVKKEVKKSSKNNP